MRILNRIEFGGIRTLLTLLLCAALFLSGAAMAQKEKKKKKDAQANDAAAVVVQLPDEQAIELALSEMLGAWQLGDAERLHKYYADDVTVVSGAWERPVIGWVNYLASYQRQRARLQEVRMDRQNTYIRVDGGLAWACYQWDFAGTVDGQPSAARGQTTLVLKKRDGRWLIVHNHTSLAQTMQPTSPAPAPAKAPPPASPQSPPSGR